jgi:hypothetical protein
MPAKNDGLYCWDGTVAVPYMIILKLIALLSRRAVHIRSANQKQACRLARLFGYLTAV